VDRRISRRTFLYNVAMIVDLVLMLVGVLLGVVHLVLFTLTAVFSFVTPPQIAEAWTTAFSALGIAQGFFPVDTFVQVSFYLLTVVGIVYFVKLVLFVYNKVRGVQQPDGSDMPSL